MDSISAIPQQPQLGKLAQFLRYLETQSPEFLPKQLDVMGLVRQLALPQASTVENLSYGNLPFTMPPEGTGAMIPQVKTGRKAEVADLVSMLSGVPGGKAVADVGTKISNEAADALVRMITRNPQATAPGVIQETAMPFMQAVAPKMPGLLAPRSELGFYSALEEAVGPLQNKGTGTQFLAQLEKTPGVKPEEIKWTGLDDFLKSRQNVTKAEVQDYLAQNRVNLQEVRLGQQPTEFRGNALYVNNELAGEIRDTSSGYAFRTPDGQYQFLDANRMDEAVNKVKQNLGIDIPETLPTKFSSYTLPGGENYREILLTLPEKTRPVTLAEVNAERAKISPFLEPLDQAQYDALVQSGEVGRVGLGGQQYRSSHFDQPNILAHMRVNDRVVDGKKTLFIEEVQSDWHQAGRKEGYGPQTKTTVEAYYQLSSGVRVPIGYGKTLEEAAASIDPKWKGMVDIKFDTRVEETGKGVPDAPFKTTWHELTLKRAIQEAAEKGYDKIAFTTGKTQAERYDLSQQVRNINVESVPEAPGVQFVDVYTNEGKTIFLEIENGTIREGQFAGKQLDEVVGKELSQRITSLPAGEKIKIEGDDLSIGGQGMKGFYDQILPKSLEKLGKKFDAKVGKTDMDGVEVWSMDITPKMRESVLTKGQPLFQAAPAIPAAGLLGDEGE